MIVTKGIETTAASKILEGWVPPYDATVIEKLKAAGMPILGKTNLDEFAQGSSTEHSAYQTTHNPWDTERVPGGSGGGSASAVAAFEAPLALGTDTGGSIRQPGALTGTVGVKPTYGGVSRYGAIAMASSLDQIGPVSRTVMAYTREAGFGDEVKRRIILGTYALSAGYYDAWYGSAQKVRTLIIEDFKKAFEKADVLVAPTSPSTAFKFGEKMDDPLAMYMNDIATIPANLAGVPAMSIPAGLSDNGLPVGFQFIAPQQRDEVMYKPAAALEAALEDSWNGPIWNDLKTPWLDGLGK